MLPMRYGIVFKTYSTGSARLRLESYLEHEVKIFIGQIREIIKILQSRIIDIKISCKYNKQIHLLRNNTIWFPNK